MAVGLKGGGGGKFEKSMEIRRWRGMFEKMAVGQKDGGGFEGGRFEKRVVFKRDGGMF